MVLLAALAVRPARMALHAAEAAAGRRHRRASRVNVCAATCATPSGELELHALDASHLRRTISGAWRFDSLLDVAALKAALRRAVSRYPPVAGWIEGDAAGGGLLLKWDAAAPGRGAAWFRASSPGSPPCVDDAVTHFPDDGSTLLVASVDHACCDFQAFMDFLSAWCHECAAAAEAAEASEGGADGAAAEPARRARSGAPAPLPPVWDRGLLAPLARRSCSAPAVADADAADAAPTAADAVPVAAACAAKPAPKPAPGGAADDDTAVHVDEPSPFQLHTDSSGSSGAEPRPGAAASSTASDSDGDVDSDDSWCTAATAWPAAGCGDEGAAGSAPPGLLGSGSVRALGGSGSMRRLVGGGSLRAAGSHSLRAAGSHSLRTIGSRSLRGAGSHSLRAANSLGAAGSRSLRAHGSHSLRRHTVRLVDSNSLQLQGSRSLQQHGSRSLQQRGSRSLQQHGSRSLQQHGSLRLAGSRGARLAPDGSAGARAAGGVAPTPLERIKSGSVSSFSRLFAGRAGSGSSGGSFSRLFSGRAAPAAKDAGFWPRPAAWHVDVLSRRQNAHMVGRGVLSALGAETRTWLLRKSAVAGLKGRLAAAMPGGAPPTANDVIAALVAASTAWAGPRKVAARGGLNAHVVVNARGRFGHGAGHDYFGSNSLLVPVWCPSELLPAPGAASPYPSPALVAHIHTALRSALSDPDGVIARRYEWMAAAQAAGVGGRVRACEAAALLDGDVCIDNVSNYPLFGFKFGGPRVAASASARFITCTRLAWVAPAGPGPDRAAGGPSGDLKLSLPLKRSQWAALAPFWEAVGLEQLRVTSTLDAAVYHPASLRNLMTEVTRSVLGGL
ncbi:MAG: hypothetical protein J3K34DRAFT_521561 [Monoraphidium minutum]|nr:MAG: hypothetical protein J3K34DRAFT_521561 [Monoraphidium minutum]